MGILDYSTTPSSNTSINGIGIQGTNNVQNFDNAMRQMMADIASGVTRKVSKAANYTAVKADNRQLIEFTAAATLSLTAAATLTDGWSCIVKANGGNVTIDPSGSEEVDGETTLALGDGTSAFIFCTGSAFHSIVMSGTDFGGNGLTNVGSLNGGPLAGFRNKVINGDFDVWQRGTSFTAAGYWADRWKGDIGGGATISRQSFTPGQTDVPGNPRYFLRHNRTSAAASANTVAEQRIEGVQTHAGKTVTVTIYAKAGAGKTFAADLLQHFGTGGTPSADVTVAAQSYAVTTSWQRGNAGQSFTFSVPSISGKTLGSDGNDYLAVRIRETSGFSTFTLDLAHVSIVEGDATGEGDPFSQKHISQEEAMCFRYYWAYPDAGAVRMPLGGTTNNTRKVWVLYPTRMRALPSLSATIIVSGTPVFKYESVAGVEVGVDTGSTTTIVDLGTFTADAEL